MSLASKIRRRVLDQRHVRAVIDAARFWRRYGTPCPTHVKLPVSGNVIYVDRREPRGRNVLICGANGQPTSKAAWHAALGIVKPTIVVDIGLNYGEFLFDYSYPRDTILLGVEANVFLRSWIDRSAGAHPNAAQFKLAFALASNQENSTQTFYIDPRSSGNSSGVIRDDSAKVIGVTVPTVTIDSFFAGMSDDHLRKQRVVLKVDVEGFEPYVFGGMRRLLQLCEQCVGIMEFNSDLIRAGGIDPRVFLDEIIAQFPVVWVRHSSAPEWTDFTQLQSDVASGKRVETDLLLFSQPALAEQYRAARRPVAQANTHLSQVPEVA